MVRTEILSGAKILRAEPTADAAPGGKSRTSERSTLQEPPSGVASSTVPGVRETRTVSDWTASGSNEDGKYPTDCIPQVFADFLTGLLDEIRQLVVYFVLVVVLPVVLRTLVTPMSNLAVVGVL